MRIGRNMKLVYEFEIVGLEYNPVPYKRTTQKMKFTKDYKKYLEWKTLLADAFCTANPKAPKRIIRRGKNWHAVPELCGAYFVETIAIYKDKTHGDTDNVAKGVLDALFKNDKYVSGSYSYEYADKGGIKVKIYEAGEAIDFIKSELGGK